MNPVLIEGSSRRRGAARSQTIEEPSLTITEDPAANVSATPVKRRRRGGERSKMGCTTCRIRRVKCDETKPACNRCSSTGRICDGYPTNSAVTPWVVVVSTDDRSRAKSKAIVPSPPFQGLGYQPVINWRVKDETIARSLLHFRSSTLGYLAGRWKVEFWADSLLRAAQANEAVWHALLGLGSAHRCFEAGLPLDDWAIQQNARAIACLRGAKARDRSLASTEAVLTVCVLLTCFEILRRQYGRAIKYAKNGVQILTQLDAGTKHGETLRSSPNSLVPLNQLHAVFAGLETTVGLVGEPLPYTSSNFKQETLLLSHERPAMVFNDAEGARVALGVVWQEMMLLTSRVITTNTESENVDAEILTSHAVLTSMFNEWITCFKGMKATMAVSITKQQWCALALLEMHHATASHFARMLLEPGEAGWDKFESEHIRLVDDAEIFLKADAETAGDATGPIETSQAPRKGAPRLMLDYGAVPMLFSVGWKCRRARTRLRAIRLLEDYPRIEAMWDSVLIAKVCRCVDAAERIGESLEAAAARDAPASDIPAQLRTTYVGVMFDTEERKMKALVMRPGEEPGSIVRREEELTW